MFPLTNRRPAPAEAARPAGAERAPEPEAALIPRADVIEHRDAFEIVADVPGVDEKHVSVHLDRSTLTIEAAPAVAMPEGSPAVYREFALMPYRRSFTLGGEIERDGITASVRDGVLRLSLPKAREAQVRKIAIQSA